MSRVQLERAVFALALVFCISGAQAADHPAMIDPPTPESVQRGAILFMNNCASCHGANGKGQSGTAVKPANLTTPSRWRFGTTREAIIRSIRDGAGLDMPPFSFVFDNDRDFVDLANYVMSIWRTGK